MKSMVRPREFEPLTYRSGGRLYVLLNAVIGASYR